MTEHNRPYDPYEHEPMPEGEEGAPPLVRTMAVVRWIILGGMILFALIMILTYFGATPWANNGGGPVQYHCPMHPTYISNQPGECPICGMTLVPVDKEGKEIRSSGGAKSAGSQQISAAHKTAKPGRYTCPMHPEVVSDKPGKCPKCGMNLEAVAEQPASTQTGHDMAGMNESSVSSQTGHDMTKMTESSSHSQSGVSDMGISPVPGLVPVTIEPRRLQLIDVRTAAVGRRSLDSNLKVVGFITPDETRIANLHLRFSGWVKELHVNQTGQLVKEGERLLSVYSQELYQAEQDYIVARQALDRSSNDNELANTRRSLLDAARQRLELLGVPADELARLDTADTPSSELWVPSPFAGYVMEKNVFAGQYIGPDQNLFSIVDLSKVWVLADVYERDLANIRLGQKARMTSTAYEGESFGGKVGFIYPAVSEQTRTLKIRLEFANPSMRLRPGMYAEIELEGSGESVLAVPADAVMDDGDRQYVFVVHDRIHFEPRLVRIGRRSNDFMEVLSGLSDGEVVVASANFLIDSESRLKAAMAGMGGTQPGAHAGHGE
jgi:Cu(I)/Ag(I) efflux system membrane fusion protein